MKLSPQFKSASSRRNIFISFIATVSIGVVGYILTATFAAGSSASLEPENGNLAGGASVVNRSGASGGKAVKFETVPSQSCTNPVFTTSDTNGGWSNGGYYVHNNMWNWQEGGPETLYACSYKNWYVESTQPNTTSVKTYPNVHLDINNMDGRPLSDYNTITSTFANTTGPNVGIYNYAYDLWLNGVGWGGGTTEMMIWTQNRGQVPLGSIRATYTAGGTTYDTWRYSGGGANVVSFVARTTILSGNLDLKAMIDWAVNRGYIPANPTVNQIGYGVEICSTNDTKQRFTFTDFSVTMD